MNKEEAINYFKENKKDLFELCNEFNLKFPYESKENLQEYYSFLKDLEKYWSDKNDTSKMVQASQKVKDFEETYHIFDPEFDENLETVFIPEIYNNSKLTEIFKFRKQIFNTQSIWHDKELDDIICQDMGEIWEEKGGQDGMYESFPFTITKTGIIRESSFYDDYFKTEVKTVTNITRSYCLDSSGGLAIIEENTKYIYPEKNIKDKSYSSFKIVTLGEDDGFHFLNSRYIYEDMCDCTKETFLSLLEKVINEYKEFQNP